MDMDRDKLLEMYRSMVSIRKFEETVKSEFAKGSIPGFVHLYAGQEAVATGVCMALRDSDTITSNHRGHGHCLAKGCDPKLMMAELFERVDGLCNGKGGSMHIADVDRGMLGANGIVGGGPPLACGAALTARTLGSGDVAVVFFGDGAAQEGTFHEAANLAAIWKLPLIFVAENNGFAQSTPARYHCAVEDIADRAAGYGIPGVVLDGMDVFAVHEAMTEAVRRGRAGEGPTLLECKTFRFGGHFEGDQQTYKDEAYNKTAHEKDPIAQFARTVTGQDLLAQSDLTAIDEQVAGLMEEVVAFADGSPFPELEDLHKDVYVQYK